MDVRGIQRLSGCECQERNAKEISAFKGGGNAYVFLPENVEELSCLIEILHMENVRFDMLGQGSNMLISDGICDSVLISTSRLCGVKIKGELVSCEAGASVAQVRKSASEKGLYGLEFLSGVPCSVGGAVRMNAGAFCAQTADYLTKIDILTRDCAKNEKFCIATKDVADYEWGYRKGVDDIIVGATFRLRGGDREKANEFSSMCLEYRRRNQPKMPSLGSVFKNGEIPSGKLIEACALKGVARGGAKISERHANFIVNVADASASDYLYLADLCKREVYRTFGIELKEEFVLIK